jgi:DNA-binding NtrC family response regulator
MEQLRKSIRAAARSQATVLVRGETGSGKTLVAHALHRQSSRAQGPFLTANCALLPAQRIEAELFGSEKGVAAPGQREGRLELAQGGTILLDEISEIPLELQTRFLRLLQDKKLVRLNGQRTVAIDVRVIATSSRPLEQQVKQKRFREDLFMALNIVPIAVPPLRERLQDLPALAEHFRERFARSQGAKVLATSPACLSALQNYDWPGNVAELRNVMQLAVLLCRDGSVLEPSHLRLGLREPASTDGAEASSPAGSVPKVDTLDEIEKKHILAALEHCQGNRTRAADVLGISIRTLRNKLRQYRTQAGADPSDEKNEE